MLARVPVEEHLERGRGFDGGAEVHFLEAGLLAERGGDVCDYGGAGVGGVADGGAGGEGDGCYFCGGHGGGCVVVVLVVWRAVGLHSGCHCFEESKGGGR